MSTFQAAPRLPREPTLIRVPDKSSQMPPEEEGRKATRNLPPPPRFPSMNDVSAPLWTQPQPAVQSPNDVSWSRRTAHPSESPAPDPTEEEPEPSIDVSATKPPSLFSKLTALFKKKNKATTPDPVRQKPPGIPPLLKAKRVICRLPDPTLFFVLQAAVILIVHTLKPHLLRTWPARIVTPLLLVPTVVATALWRPTKVISLKPKPDFISAAAPIPNAGKLVTLGESLRVREAAVVKAEDEVRRGQMQLEVLRKEIEGRLPPQVSIANLLEQENDPSAPPDLAL